MSLKIDFSTYITIVLAVLSVKCGSQFIVALFSSGFPSLIKRTSEISNWFCITKFIWSNLIKVILNILFIKKLGAVIKRRLRRVVKVVIKNVGVNWQGVEHEDSEVE